MQSRENKCTKEWECNDSEYWCNQTISDLFQIYFRYFWYISSMNCSLKLSELLLNAAEFEPLGFGTTGGRTMQMKEVATFLGHDGARTSCGYGIAIGGPLDNHEMSLSRSCCAEHIDYPCTPRVEYYEYYGRGALPVYWNFNYGSICDGIKTDLLNHPELLPEILEQNATTAFQAAMWRWMNPMKKKKQASAHDVFVSNWKPNKNDNDSQRLPGFGAIMYILYADQVCGQGFIDDMNVIISHNQYYPSFIVIFFVFALHAQTEEPASKSVARSMHLGQGEEKTLKRGCYSIW